MIAWLTEAVLRNERTAAPVGSWQEEKLTFSLPSIIGAIGVEAVLRPDIDQTEHTALQESNQALRTAAEQARAAHH